MIRIYLLLFIVLTGAVYPQTKWKKPVVKDETFTLFKSPQALNLHTAEVVPKGDWFYGITHRFTGTFDASLQNYIGFGDFFGMDAGAVMRTKLGYGFTDNFMATLGRTGKADAFDAKKIYDLELKYKLYKNKEDFFIPIIISAMGTISYTGQAEFDDSLDISNRLQYIAQLMINTKLFDRLAIGINPTFLYNSCIPCQDETKNSIILGSYIQYYIGDDMTSFILEANNTLSGFRGNGRSPYYDSYAFGVELETGGHFFKFLLGNNVNVNQTQFLLGSRNEFTFQQLHLGFQITRNL